MTEFQRNLNALVIRKSNTDLGSNSNSNLLIFKVIVIVIYYIDLGNHCNSNSNILIFKVIVTVIIILQCIVIGSMSGIHVHVHVHVHVVSIYIFPVFLHLHVHVHVHVYAYVHCVHVSTIHS